MATSRITIENQIVTKKIIKYSEYDVYPREKYWLKFFNQLGYNWVPQLLSYDDKNRTLTMTYVGERINKNNKPVDWESQLEDILNCLERMNIKHNDIKPDEILVKDGQVHLIDFGWMNINDDWSCNQGFDSRVKPSHYFQDHNALERLHKVLD